MRNFRSLVLGLVLVSLAGCDLTEAPALKQTTASVNCSFGKSISEDKKRRLAFTSGKTTRETWSLDGMIRATNSTYWYEVARHLNSTVFVGDFGETLYITAPKDEMLGSYEGSIESMSAGFQFSYRGECTLQR